MVDEIRRRREDLERKPLFHGVQSSLTRGVVVVSTRVVRTCVKM